MSTHIFISYLHSFKIVWRNRHTAILQSCPLLLYRLSGKAYQNLQVKHKFRKAMDVFPRVHYLLSPSCLIYNRVEFISIQSGICLMMNCQAKFAVWDHRRSTIWGEVEVIFSHHRSSLKKTKNINKTVGLTLCLGSSKTGMSRSWHHQEQNRKVLIK